MYFTYKHPRSLIYKPQLIHVDESVDSEILSDIARSTDGFSGREITKMVIAWHDAAFT